MKQCLRCVAVCVFILWASLATTALYAQAGIFNPNDPVVTYDSTKKPTQPKSGLVGKWVRTPRVSWSTSSFKCYIYNGMAFRLKYPKNYDSTKAYPILIFFHGLGEFGNIYDNEFQLYLGGQIHANAVDQGKFNGFLLYPQHGNTNGIWSSTNMANVNNLIEKVMIPQKRVDPFRVYIDGLSAGGATTWQFLAKYTKLVAAATPISAAYSSLFDSAQKYKYTPIYHFQGGQDPSPTPSSARSLGNKILGTGGNYKYKEYPNRGHDCWNEAWSEPDYFPFYAAAYKSNPWPLYGRTEFCQGEAVRDTLGVTPGFDGYEWRKNGALISGATSFRLVVTDYGTYDCRVKKGSTWSSWSLAPVVVKVKSPTVQPTITLGQPASVAIPAPDGSTTVPLQVPDGYVSYKWVMDGSTTVLSTTRTLAAATPGKYKVTVTEKWGCATSTTVYSQPFTVVNANGSNKPDAVTNLTATATSKTAIKLAWSQTSSPAYNETGFEVYQATASGGPYVFKTLTAANATSATISSLNSGTAYFYKVRAANSYAASAVTGPTTATTQSDKTAPSVPGSLRTGVITRSSIELIWNASTDDVGVVSYDIYVNGVKAYAYSNATKGTVYNLQPSTSYTFYVRARDLAGNLSAQSTQITGKTSSGSLLLDPSMGSNKLNFSMYLNFNVVNPASFPWNNTNVLPSEGLVVSNLRSYASNNSGVKMTLSQNFSGYNPDGMNTGNNSGVYPDNVMRSSYYCDKGQVAKVKFYNLSLKHKYSFIFFGSRNGTDDRTSVYTINGQSVSLNASLNTTKTVQIDNVAPDQNGNVTVEVSLGPTSIFAYLNSVVIKAYSLVGTTTSMAVDSASTLAATVVPEVGDSSTTTKTSAHAYPNPVHNEVTVSAVLGRATPLLTLKLTDAAGSVLSTQKFANLPAGNWQQRVALNANSASLPGIYFIHLSGLPQGGEQVLKLIKVK